MAFSSLLKPKPNLPSLALVSAFFVELEPPGYATQAEFAKPSFGFNIFH
jgi:hypothetical protein